jgi:hypothetical protein
VRVSEAVTGVHVVLAGSGHHGLETRPPRCCPTSGRSVLS